MLTAAIYLGELHCRHINPNQQGTETFLCKCSPQSLRTFLLAGQQARLQRPPPRPLMSSKRYDPCKPLYVWLVSIPEHKDAVCLPLLCTNIMSAHYHQCIRIP